MAGRASSALHGASGRGGFTLVALIVIITVIGIMTTVVSRSWKIAAREEKEKELLWRGSQFRQAIGRYYEARELDKAHQMAPKSYPAELKDLLQDPRSFDAHRYIRRIYTDPMTGKDDWVPVFDNAHHIMGVHSNSDAAPLKRDNFDLADADFRGKDRYSEWVFQYAPAGLAQAQPQQQQAQPPPAQPQPQPHGIGGI